MQTQMMAPQQPMVPQMHQMQAQAPVVAPQVPAIADGGAKKKGIKLKNAAMARPGQPAPAPKVDDGSKDDGHADGDDKAAAQLARPAPIDLTPPNKIFEKTLMLRI